MPIHLLADADDIAPVVLLPGDPGRATLVASMLDGARCYNEHRGLLGYTGEWRGSRVSVQTTGMGAPSAAIVAEELARLGARVLIRIGTCGAVAERVELGDLVVASAAISLDGTTRQYHGGEEPPMVYPATDMLDQLFVAALGAAQNAHLGCLLSEDAFYGDKDWQGWRDAGILAVEMEAAAIFTVAGLRGVQAGAICLAVNDVITGEDLAPEARAAGIEAMVRAALETAVQTV